MLLKGFEMETIDELRIQNAVNARKDVNEIVEIITEFSDKYDQPAFWKHLYERLGVVPEDEIKIMPDKKMSDDESKKFDNQLIGFGQHNGKAVREVPLPYLVWLDEQPDFRRQLRRYLASDRVQSEM